MAIGVADEHERALNRADEVADAGRVGGQAPQRVDRGEHGVPALTSESMRWFQLADVQLMTTSLQRCDANASRISCEKSSGSSQAAKWPPLSTSLK